MSAPVAGGVGVDWGALSAEIDALMTLDDAARDARLAAIASARPDDAARLRAWLAAIAASSGYLESTGSQRDAAAALERVGPWRVLGLAGRGGMGEVYRAERADGAFERVVAVKLLRHDVRVDPARLAGERVLLARLDHPHIARLLDGGVAPDGRPYLVTEWVDGVPLDHWFATRRPDLATRVAVFAQLAQAVAYAHAALVVHRDLKPGNVLVDALGRVKLLDFGIARLLDDPGEALLTQDHVLTPAFAAPEQLAGGALTTRTDVYALGVLLFLLLTGRAPHAVPGRSLRELIDDVCERDAPLASRVTGEGGVAASALAGDLDAIVATALAREPARRYASAEALLRDLQAWQSHRPVSVRAPSWRYRSARFLRRHRLGAALAATATIAVVAGVVGVWWQGRIAAHERDSARVERDSAQANAERYAVLNAFLVRVFREVGDDAERLTPAQFLDRASKLVLAETAPGSATRRQMLAALIDVQAMRGDPVAAQAALEQLLVEDSTLPPAQHARALCQLGGARARQGDYEGAAEPTAKGLAMARELRGTAQEEFVFCAGVQALQFAHTERTPAAVALVDEAWAELAKHGEEPSVVRRRANLSHTRGDVLTLAGDAAGALAAYQQALALSRDLGEGESQETAQTALAIAGAYNALGRLADARAAYARALPLQRRYAGEGTNYAVELTNAANVLNTMEDGAGARANLEQALAVHRRMGLSDPATLGHANLELGKASTLLREPERALRELAEAERWFREGLGENHPYAWFPAFTRARVLAQQGDLPAVQRELDRVLEHFRDDEGMRGRLLLLLAELELDAGANGAARSDSRDGLTLAVATMPPMHHNLAWARAVRAGALLSSGDAADREQARALLDQALPVLWSALGDGHSRVKRAMAWQAAAQ